MKKGWIILGMVIGLLTSQTQAQSGLKAEYYTGTNFETKVLIRVDPQIRFDWRGRSPAAGMGSSYFSVRWTGKLLAPASGQYIFSALVDDGIRVWVGNRKVIDAWALHDDESFKGAVVLEAGKYYDLRVDYFNDLLEGKINLLWQRPDEINLPFSNGTTISGQYLYQKIPTSPRPVVPPKPITKPTVVVAPTPKPAPKPVVVPPKPKPVVAAVIPPVVVAAPEKTPEAETFGSVETGKMLVLENVFFERSNYVLLPESFAELDKLVRTLRQNPAVRINIAGHTDNVGDPRLNQSLSEYRARVVMNYLIRHGIAGDRVGATGYGGSRPVAGNDTETGRAKNRRVEFVVK